MPNQRERESKHLFPKLINNRYLKRFFQHFIAVISCVLVVSFGIVALTRATTIGENISTGGTLSVTGISAFSANVGIGTSTPSAKLDVIGDINISTGSYFKYNGLNFAMASTSLNNYFTGGAGNLTMTGGNNTAVGYQALLSDTTAQKSVAVGYQSLNAVTTNGGSTAVGYQVLYNDNGGANSGYGWRALYSNTTGDSNVGVGTEALKTNTSGVRNVGVGVSALLNSTTANENTGIGHGVLSQNTTGYYNSAVGFQALGWNSTGYYNSAVGYKAGRFITDGTTGNLISNTSLYLGAETKALASGDTNEIVIGYNTTGLGSNTAVFGNSSITQTALRGTVGIGTTTFQTGDSLVVNGPIRFTDNGTKPTCSATYRGMIWRDDSASGVADTFELCAKNSADAYTWRRMPNEYILAYQHSQVGSHTGNTLEITLATISVPGGTLGPNGILRINLLWSYSGSTNVKTIRTYYGGTAFSSATQSTAINTASAQLILIRNRNATNSQIGPPGNQSGGIGVGSASITASIDTTADQNIVITGQLANSADTITLEVYTIEVINP